MYRKINSKQTKKNHGQVVSKQKKTLKTSGQIQKRVGPQKKRIPLLTGRGGVLLGGQLLSPKSKVWKDAKSVAKKKGL